MRKCDFCGRSVERTVILFDEGIVEVCQSCGKILTVGNFIAMVFAISIIVGLSIAACL